MKIRFIYLAISIIYLTSCSKYIFKDSFQNTKKHNKNFICIEQKQKRNQFQKHIHISSIHYGIDEKLIKAIIQVESNYNPSAISKSNAIGLMQLKASTAGKDVHKLKGLTGEPSEEILKNAETNIDFGAAYLSILQKKLSGISNTQTRRYAIIVSYVNGLNSLLNMFSMNHNIAIKKINKFTPDKFYQYIQQHHPEQQAQTYLYKVNSVYLLIH